MTQLQAIILGIIQGITEMLPVSSSTHLMVFSRLQGLPNQRLSFDIFLNIGSLLAVILFFWPQVLDLIKGGFAFILNKKSKNRDMFITMVVANIPIIIFGGLAEVFFDVDFHSPTLISSNLIIFAVILWLCDKESENAVKNRTDVSKKDAIFTGIAQVCTIMPGVSRLGACFSMLRYLKYSRLEAFRFSLIMSILPVSGACFLKTLKIFTGSLIIENWTMVSLGCVFSFLFGIVTLFAMDSFLKRRSMLCFVVYRILFGIFILTQYKII